MWLSPLDMLQEALVYLSVCSSLHITSVSLLLQPKCAQQPGSVQKSTSFMSTLQYACDGSVLQDYTALDLNIGHR